MLETGATVQRLAGGFDDISGGAVAADGDFYFVDARWQRIHRWSVAERRLSTVADAPLQPVNLAFDQAGNLLVVSYAGDGTVYALKPGASDVEPTVLAPQAAARRPGLAAILPVGDWRLRRTPDGALQARPHHYLSPDGSCYVSATRGFVEGATSWGVKDADLLRAFGLQRARPGDRVYLTGEADVATWSAQVGEDGSLSDARLFVDQGGEGVAADVDGNVYLAAGEVYVYDRSGTLLETIHPPARPTQVIFGGPDRRTLFLPARDALYAVRTRRPGGGQP